MIDRIIAFSIRRRFAVIAASLPLALFGLFALAQTPVDAIPDLSENQVIVYVDWPGHNPREIDDQIAYPLSVALRGTPGVKTIRASSDVNYAWLSLICDDTADILAVRERITARLTHLDVPLPEGAAPKLAPDSAATGQIFWYALEGGGLDLGRLRALQDFFVKGQLAAVPGVAEVASVGGMPIEYQIEIDPVRMRSQGVTADQIAEAARRSNSSSSGHVVHKGNAEYAVRGEGWLGSSGIGAAPNPSAVLRDLETVPIRASDGRVIRLTEVAHVGLGSAPRRGALEMDGSETVGGVVLMARGENPREVTSRLKAKIRELQPGLPAGVRIMPFYDRTPLIDGAIGTVTRTILEAMAIAAVCVSAILLHARTSLIVVATLPLAALSSFAALWLARVWGIAEVETNIMSLAGIAISIGVLADSSIVMSENAMHRLRLRFGDSPVTGDASPIVLDACRTVGRPIFFSIAVMLLSFLPVFALGGIEGKMFRPLAITKCLALASVAVLAITLVPALCSVLIRGRLRDENASPIVRGVVEVYRPVLDAVLDRPAPLIWILGATMIAGAAASGIGLLFRVVVAGSLVAFALTIAAGSSAPKLGRWRRPWGWVGLASLLVVALVAERGIEPLQRTAMTPLDEGMVMDMPITIPRASITQSTDDMKARDMILCRFPEVDMVVGKAGRAETPSDPAPLDMIETMVNFRPREFWPRRKLSLGDADRQTRITLQALIDRGWIDAPDDFSALVQRTTEAIQPSFDSLMREYAYQRNQELTRALPFDPLEGLTAEGRERWAEHTRRLNSELIPRAAETYVRLAIEEGLIQGETRRADLANFVATLKRWRESPPRSVHHHDSSSSDSHHAMSRTAEWPKGLERQPALDELQAELAERFASGLTLRKLERADLIGAGGELDRSVPMPGWTNVWTMPIQNRVDMLATGVNSMIGVRVLGRGLDDVIQASEAIAVALKGVPGAADVVADPIRGKGHIEVRIDRVRALRWGITAADVNEAVATAIGGRVIGMTVEGRERHPIRVRYGRDWRTDEESVRRVLIPSFSAPSAAPTLIPLAEVADVRVVEGPATIKSENSFPRNYVRLNVRDRDAAEFVEEAKRMIRDTVRLPEGTHIEWTGRFEHARRTEAMLRILIPLALLLIFLVLAWTFRDLADAALMLLAIPGAMAGGALFQWLLDEPFSITVWLGYIACFGMAASTGVIMLIYLREAVENAGGLANLTLDELRQAVLNGAAHRLRPKLLTEAVTVLSLAPMLWADGVGSEVIRPMAAPVLGGLLVADEIIDLLLPVLFHQIRRARWRAIHNAVPTPPSLPCDAGASGGSSCP